MANAADGAPVPGWDWLPEPAGLANAGATCHANAAAQALMAAEPRVSAAVHALCHPGGARTGGWAGGVGTATGLVAATRRVRGAAFAVGQSCAREDVDAALDALLGPVPGGYPSALAAAADDAVAAGDPAAVAAACDGRRRAAAFAAGDPFAWLAYSASYCPACRAVSGARYEVGRTLVVPPSGLAGPSGPRCSPHSPQSYESRRVGSPDHPAAGSAEAGAGRTLGESVALGLDEAPEGRCPAGHRGLVRAARLVRAPPCLALAVPGGGAPRGGAPPGGWGAAIPLELDVPLPGGAARTGEETGVVRYRQSAQIEHFGGPYGGHYTARALRRRPGAEPGAAPAVYAFDDQGVAPSAFDHPASVVMVFYTRLPTAA
jgi:hypothetical protein